MFYEEKLINGILCHRNCPDGEWIQFTLESLSTAFIAMKSLAVDRLGVKLANEQVAANVEYVATPLTTE